MKVIDFHCDTILQLMTDTHSSLRENQYSVDIVKLRQAHSLGQFFALFVDLEETNQPFNTCLAMAKRFYDELTKNKESIAFAGSYQELCDNQAQGKLSAFLTVEEGGVLEGDIHKLSFLYERGVRLMTLTWNYPNQIGYPNYQWQYQQQGLTSFGREVVEKMNALGMVIDVSHLSDQGFYDVAALSTKPFVASHSNARSVWNHPRNLSDEMIKIIADKGGILGLNFEKSFLGNKKLSMVEDMLSHLQHIVKVGGEECAAIGSDFDGIDPGLEIEHIGNIHLLLEGMDKAGFSAALIEKIAYTNALRVIKDVL